MSKSALTVCKYKKNLQTNIASGAIQIVFLYILRLFLYILRVGPLTTLHFLHPCHYALPRALLEGQCESAVAAVAAVVRQLLC